MDSKRRPRKWEKAFLAKLRNTCNVRASCEAANISRSEVYQHRDACPEFKTLWDEAVEDAADILEARAWDRSKTSDTLLQFLLKAHRPKKYRDVLHNEITGKDGEPLTVQIVEVIR